MDSDDATTAEFASVSDDEAHGVGQRWWDADAGRYLAEHGAYLGPADFLWCPEGLRESAARLLGDVRGRTVLEVGSGAAQCSRWLSGAGARVIATDISAGMLAASHRLDAELSTSVPCLQADARALPLATASIDIAFTAYGALPFVAEGRAIHAAVARVLRPGGRWVFSVTHPIRWAFPDDPGEGGLTVSHSYFDRTPYLERSDTGELVYVEYHRTLGDHVEEITGAGLVLDRLVEPEWTPGEDHVWSGWSALRGEQIPGTAIFVTHKPD
jgi:SAM-dependent methyltransferase